MEAVQLIVIAHDSNQRLIEHGQLPEDTKRKCGFSVRLSDPRFCFQVALYQHLHSQSICNQSSKLAGQKDCQLSLVTTSKHPSSAPSNSPTRCFNASFSSFKIPTTLQASDALTP